MKALWHLLRLITALAICDGAAVASPMFFGMNVNPAAGGDVSVITGQSLGTSRNDFTGYVGFYFTVGGANITVTSLGIWIPAGHQSGTHTIALGDSGGGIGGSATVSADLSLGTPGSFFYVTLGTPQVLTAGQTYCCFAHETQNDGDNWYSNDTTVTTTSAISISASCYMPDSGGFFTVAGANTSYVPVSFKYH